MGNETYVRVDCDKEEIVNKKVSYSKKLGLDVGEKVDLLDSKKHKHPTGKRFIIASKHCSTKLISKSVSLVFKLIY